MHRKIIHFLSELNILGILLPGKVGFGYATSALMEYTTERGSILQFVNEMEKASKKDPFSHEYRLNGAGLKMLWEWNLSKSKIKFVICGDQREYYPEFAKSADILIKENKFNKEVY